MDDYENDVDNLSLENVNEFTTDPTKTAFKFLAFEVEGNRNEEVSFAQAVAAAFGSETARAPVTFLSSLMLLDIMQSGKSYGKDKYYSLAALLQRPYDVVSKTAKIKYSGSLKFPSSSPSYPERALSLDGMYNKGELADVGGKLAMAGKDSYNLMDGTGASTFDSSNIVHVKQVGIFINWLCAQTDVVKKDSVSGQVKTVLPKEDSLKEIERLAKTRALGYDYMSKGIMVADV